VPPASVPTPPAAAPIVDYPSPRPDATSADIDNLAEGAVEALVVKADEVKAVTEAAAAALEATQVYDEPPKTPKKKKAAADPEVPGAPKKKKVVIHPLLYYRSSTFFCPCSACGIVNELEMHIDCVTDDDE